MPISFLLSAEAAPILGGLIGAGGSLAGGAISAGAANRAADVQLQEFNQIQQSLAPFLQSGQSSLGALSQGLGTGGGQFDPNAPLLRNPLQDQGPFNFG